MKYGGLKTWRQPIHHSYHIKDLTWVNRDPLSHFKPPFSILGLNRAALPYLILWLHTSTVLNFFHVYLKRFKYTWPQLCVRYVRIMYILYFWHRTEAILEENLSKTKHWGQAKPELLAHIDYVKEKNKTKKKPKKKPNRYMALFHCTRALFCLH